MMNSTSNESTAMASIELIFPDGLNEAEVSRLLRSNDSGFESDSRRPLESAVVDGFTIAGVVLNALSLAATIWSLKNQLDDGAAAKKIPSKGIRIRRPPNGPTKPLPNDNVDAIAKALEDMSRSRK
jgi:hypothetical protein